jgi:hypothetical protein
VIVLLLVVVLESEDESEDDDEDDSVILSTHSFSAAIGTAKLCGGAYGRAA